MCGEPRDQIAMITNECVYIKTKCDEFLKTIEKYGELSNMAGGYGININGLGIRTSEALYLASRFPCNSGIQRKIVS